MELSELMFIGIAGSIVALNRATGAQVWTTQLKGRDFVNVVLHEGRLLATTYGEVFCLEPPSLIRSKRFGTPRTASLPCVVSY